MMIDAPEAGLDAAHPTQTPPARPPHLQSDLVIREFLDRVVSSVFAVDTILLKLPTRGRQPVAEARQVAMYLAHVACGLSFTEVGQVFERDRTTVSHACRRVEDRREDPAFDSAVDLLETTIRMIHLEGDGTCRE